MLRIEFITLFILFLGKINAQQFNYSDTILHQGGKFFYVNEYRVYGQYKEDTTKNQVKKNIRCFDGVNEITNKILYGKCLFYFLPKSIDSNRVVHKNDTSMIEMIFYYSDSGVPLKTVYFNRDGTVQYVYIKKEND